MAKFATATEHAARNRVAAARDALEKIKARIAKVQSDRAGLEAKQAEAIYADLQAGTDGQAQFKKFEQEIAERTKEQAYLEKALTIAAEELVAAKAELTRERRGADKKRASELHKKLSQHGDAVLEAAKLVMLNINKMVEAGEQLRALAGILPGAPGGRRFMVEHNILLEAISFDLHRLYTEDAATAGNRRTLKVQWPVALPGTALITGQRPMPGVTARSLIPSMQARLADAEAAILDHMDRQPVSTVETSTSQ